MIECKFCNGSGLLMPPDVCASSKCPGGQHPKPPFKCKTCEDLGFVVTNNSDKFSTIGDCPDCQPPAHSEKVERPDLEGSLKRADDLGFGDHIRYALSLEKPGVEALNVISWWDHYKGGYKVHEADMDEHINALRQSGKGE